MENKISLGSLGAALSRTTGKSKKHCDDFLREFFKLAAETLEQGESLKVKGFGTFKVTEMESRESIDVTTGNRLEIPSYKKVIFTPSKELAATINAPFQDFESVEMEEDMPEDALLEVCPEDFLNDENKVESGIIEAGSDEEAEDDNITYEGYTLIEEEKKIEELQKNSDKEELIETPEEPKYDNSIEEVMGIETKEEESVGEELMVEEPIQINSDDEEQRNEEPSVEDSRESYNFSGEPEIEDKERQRKRVRVYVHEEESVKSRFGIGFLTGALSMLVACLVIFIIGCFHDWWPEKIEGIKGLGSNEIPVVIEEPKQEEDIVDSEEETVSPEPVYDTVSTTRYLTTIAREHYGDFNLWPYIYIENESILGHPDRITPGTQVVVPDLKKYGVDPSNPEDVAQAKKLGQEIYAKYR